MNERSENTLVLAYLLEQSEPPRPDVSIEVGGYELHCHPDLVERMGEIVQGSSGRIVMRYGLPVCVHLNEVIVAFAKGTATIAVRFTGRAEADGIFSEQALSERGWESVRALNEDIRSHLGAEWIVLDPWQTEARSQDGLKALRGWLTLALGAAAVLGGYPR